MAGKKEREHNKTKPGKVCCRSRSLLPTGLDLFILYAKRRLKHFWHTI